MCFLYFFCQKKSTKKLATSQPRPANTSHPPHARGLHPLGFAGRWPSQTAYPSELLLPSLIFRKSQTCSCVPFWCAQNAFQFQGCVKSLFCNKSCHFEERLYPCFLTSCLMSDLKKVTLNPSGQSPRVTVIKLRPVDFICYLALKKRIRNK